MAEIHSQQTAALGELYAIRNRIADIEEEFEELEEELHRLKLRKLSVRREFQDLSELIDAGDY